ncbi:nitronate monooxygenase [Candidatus Woesearchaeota archaeon]|nr:nitronate monooxygenase [Candidatus Woesearchaeota archaeon]
MAHSLKQVQFPWADRPRLPVIQGGMGVGISLTELASAVGNADAMGTVSSAALDQLTSMRVGSQLGQTEAVAREIADTKQACGYANINIMVKLERTYEQSVEGAVRGQANMIISGAGFPLALPSLVAKFFGSKDHKIALVPIVSSDKTLQIITERWLKEGHAPPDAVILAGPKSAGHLGFNYRKIQQAGEHFLRDYDVFDALLGPVLEYATTFRIPVFVSGGIRTRKDIDRALSLGAAGVHVGTPFVATPESGASERFKQTLVESSNADVLIGTPEWGSPAGYPFRYLRGSPLAQDKKGKHFCICCALGNSMRKSLSHKAGDCPEQYVRPLNGNCPAQGNVIREGLYTVSADIDTITAIKPAKQVIDELVN